MPTTPTDDLVERLKDLEYAKLYGAEDAKLDFAMTLTKARKSLNLTQKGLADKLSISQPYVAKLESGEANSTLGRIGSLLAAIDLRLVTGTAPLKPEPMLSTTGVIPAGVADDVGAHVYSAANIPFVAAEPVDDWPISKRVDYPSRVAVGGTVQ